MRLAKPLPNQFFGYLQSDAGFIFRFCSSLLIFLVGIFASTCAHAQADVSKVKYKWKPGQQFEYEFEVKYQVDGEQKKLTGSAAYELHKKNVSKDLSNGDLELVEEGEATSTAFAVTADGYLLTCAHCVRGAKKINVTIGDETKRAEVIDADYDQDLAIIKVEAKDLPFVALGKTREVELAQDVRAIGYPLSDVLGSSVKITRGSVAGFIDDGSSAKTLQIDVAVNHGNSGGPLVDETGSVVGVVNAKLSGETIAKVGFAIPIKLACEMLDRNKVKYDSEELKTNLSGPELAKKLTPSVFFVKAEIGPGGENSFSNFRYSTKGSLSRPTSRGNQRESIGSDAIIGADGIVLDSANRVGLPLLLGSVAEMPFEKLPSRSAKTWSRANMFVVPLPKSASKTRRIDPFDPFGRMPGFPGMRGPRLPRGFGGFGGFGRSEPEVEKPEMRMALGRSMTVYKIHKRDGNLVTILKKFSLDTVEDDAEYANLKMKHDSELVFDLDVGMFVAQKMNGSVKIKLGDKVVDFPVEMTYKKIGFEDFSSPEKAGGKRKGETAAAKSNPMPTVGLTGDQIDQLVKHKSEEIESNLLLSYLNRLSVWNDEQPRKPEIVKALVELSKTGEPNVKKLAIDALLNWDREAATPLVIAGFKNASAFSKRTWITKLGKTEHVDAAVVLSEQLKSPRLFRYAKAALIALGANGEAAVGSVLKANAKDEQVANACLDVLSKVGTEKSADLLKELLLQPEWKSRSQAESVLNLIGSR